MANKKQTFTLIINNQTYNLPITNIFSAYGHTTGMVTIPQNIKPFTIKYSIGGMTLKKQTTIHPGETCEVSLNNNQWVL